MDHGWKVFSLTISPVAGKDGTRWLASGGGFKVRLWDPETGANKTPPSLRRHLEEVELNVKRVEWLDSQHLIIGFEDTTPLVWNVQTDQRLTPAEYATIKEQTVGLNRSDIQKRELPGAIRQQLEALTEERGRENYVLGSDCLTSVAWLDSRRVATAHYDGRVRIWDSEAAKEITPAGLIGHGYGRTEVVWLNSRRLASGGGDQWVRIWHIDAERNQTFEGFAEQEDSAPKGITVASLEEDLLATIGGEDFPGPDGSVRIWGTKTGQDRTPMGFNMHRPRASALAQLDAQIVAIGYENGRVEIRDLKTGNNVTSPTLNGHSCGNAWFGFPGTREVTALSWLHASQLASGTMDGKVKIWDTLKGDVTPPKLAARHAEFGLYGLEWLDSHRLVIVGNEDVEIWDLTADQGYTPAGSVGRGDLSTPFSRLQKGRIACIGWYGRVKILDTEWLGDITPTVFSREPDRRVMALTGVGEHLLATLDEQHWLQIWDVDCERTIASTIVHDARSMRFDTVRRELQVFTACETGRLMSVQFSLPGF